MGEGDSIILEGVQVGPSIGRSSNQGSTDQNRSVPDQDQQNGSLFHSGYCELERLEEHPTLPDPTFVGYFSNCFVFLNS